MKRLGFTLVELFLSIAILGIIMAALGSIFATSIKNFRTQTVQTSIQREVNIVSDNIGKNIKQASSIPETYDTFTRSADTLIIELPAANSDFEFIYSGSTLVNDYIVYYVDGTNLKKKLYANPSSYRYPDNGQDIVILEDIESFTCTYNLIQGENNVEIVLSKSHQVYGSAITASAEKTSRLRNQQ